MICKACGHVCSDDSQFCPQCGLPLSIDDTLEEEPGGRPVLHGVVPYVVSGQETGAIPCVCAAEESSAEPEGEGSVSCSNPACDAAGSHDSQSGAEEDAEDSPSCNEGDDAPSGPSAEGDAGAGDSDSCEEALEPVRPSAPAGVVSWGREFPTAQITAIMPPVQSEDGEDAAAQDPASDDEAGCDAGDSEAERVAGAEEDAVCEPAEVEDEEGPASDQEDEPEEEPAGAHAASVDRSALTARLERIPEPGLGSTAVIPSISQEGPARYSDYDRDRADAARKIPPVVVKGVLGAAAVIALAVGVRLAVFNVEVPQVVDAPSSEARARLDRAGFEVRVQSKVTEEAADGTVLACSPQGGSKQRKGATVTLTVAASQTIPDVVGMDLDAARAMLEEQGATKVKVSLKESNQPENTIVEVAPQVGQPFNLDQEIVLTVATTAYMPDVVGSTEEEACKVLEEAGYVPETQWVDAQEAPGTVVATDPQAGELANIGSTVTLNVVPQGPATLASIMDYYSVQPADLSAYLKWKGFAMAGSFAYTDDWSGNDYVSQKWRRSDGTTVSFTPAPYLEDDVLDMADYMAQGTGFQGVRIFIPASSEDSLGTDLTLGKVEECMEACGLQGMTDSCTKADLDYNGRSGAELGIGEFVCAQGTQDGKVWTILITPEGTYLGSGGYECYPDMEPICDCVAVNEMFGR